jgi:hypothetical protein
VSDCGDYQVRLTEAFRFADEDTLVFHLTIENKSDQPLDHTPEKLEVHAGARVFNPSVTDLVSAIPPHESPSATSRSAVEQSGLTICRSRTISRSRFHGVSRQPTPLSRTPKTSNPLLFYNEPAPLSQFLPFAYRRPDALPAGTGHCPNAGQ